MERENVNRPWCLGWRWHNYAKRRGHCRARLAGDRLLALDERIGGEDSPGDPYLFCVNLPSLDTVSACRPLWRRAASTRRPPLVAMRARKPKRRNRGMRFGWYVRLVDTKMLLDPAMRIHLVRRIEPGAWFFTSLRNTSGVSVCRDTMWPAVWRTRPARRDSARRNPRRATERLRHGSIPSDVPHRQTRLHPGGMSLFVMEHVC